VGQKPRVFLFFSFCVFVFVLTAVFASMMYEKEKRDCSVEGIVT